MMVQGQHERVRAFMCAWAYIRICVQPGQMYILAHINVLLSFGTL